MTTPLAPNSQERLHPYFIDYYTDLKGPLEITDADYERGKLFTDGLGRMHKACSDLGMFAGTKYFESGVGNGVIVVKPEFPIDRTVRKEGTSYEWMVTPENSQSSDLLVIRYIAISPSLEEPTQLVADAVSPGYRKYKGEASLQENYRFNPLKHTFAILKGRHEPDDLISGS